MRLCLWPCVGINSRSLSNSNNPTVGLLSTGNAIEQADLWYKEYKEQFRFSLYTDLVLSSQQMRGRGQLCAVTLITEEDLGINQVHRLATNVVGNVRKGLNCEKEV